MRFSNGHWLLRDGVQAAHPVEVYDITQSAGELVVHAPTRPIRHRGDLLQGPVATVRFSSPMPTPSLSPSPGWKIRKVPAKHRC